MEARSELKRNNGVAVTDLTVAANGINGGDMEKKDEERADADGGYSILFQTRFFVAFLT